MVDKTFLKKFFFFLSAHTPPGEGAKVGLKKKRSSAVTIAEAVQVLWKQKFKRDPLIEA